MDVYFQELGRAVAAEWKRKNFSLEVFPSIVGELLAAEPPAERVDVARLVRGFLLDDEQPAQTHSGFGQPELIVFDHPRFYIQVLFWMDGTTDIHQHEFSGAFHVLAGSSLHARYEFASASAVTPHFRMGDVKRLDIELLDAGRTVPIWSGGGCIHSLFHLDTPSITVVVRTQNDPGTGPQFNYLPPHVAFDPIFNDALSLRRKQLLDVLEQLGDESYVELVVSMVGELDFERGFFLLQHVRGPLGALGAWAEVLAAFEAKHGVLAAGVAVTLEEEARREVIKGLRCTITEPEHRFFLALLMNVVDRVDMLKLVERRCPGDEPVDTVMRWVEELSVVSDEGLAFLDASFPCAVEEDLEEQAGMILGVLREFLLGGAMPGGGATGGAGKSETVIRGVLERSSLRVLVS